MYFIPIPMPTTKKGINITLPHDLEISIISLAKRDTVAVSKKATELIKLALELEEDDFLNNLAEERMKDKKAKYYSHKKAWA